MTGARVFWVDRNGEQQIERVDNAEKILDYACSLAAMCDARYISFWELALDWKGDIPHKWDWHRPR